MDIGAKLARLEKQVAELQRASRLSHAALDDTALEVRDGGGALRGIVGQQGDGTTAVNIVNGGPPPAPATPFAAPALGGVSAGWDGTFADGAIIPLDWARVEVHASPTAAFTPGPDTLKATVETAQGGIVYVPSSVPLYVALLARNTSGAASPATAEVGPYAPKPVAGEIGIGEITSTLIADGAVTTPKVFANAITTALLAAGSVDATALKADAITGKTITGGDIIGATVTGSEVRTGTSGERVVLTPTPPFPLVQRASMLLYSGAASELGPGVLNTGVTSGIPSTILGSQATALDSLGRQIRTSLGLIPPNPGVHGGRFIMTTLNPTGSTTAGRVSVDGLSATDASGQANLTLYAEDGATTPKTAQLTLGTGRATLFAEAFEVRPAAATALAPIFLNAPTGHTGALLRLQLNTADRLTVSTTGDVTTPGLMAAGSVTATGAVQGDSLAVASTTFTTYTPTVAGGGSATYTTRTGWYYKLGKMVYFNAEFVVGAAGSGTTNVTVTAPSSIYRGGRQVIPVHARGAYLFGLAGNGHAYTYETGSGAVIDQITVSNDNAQNRDGILQGVSLVADARVTIQGWYREA